MKPAASEHRNTAAPPISRGWPQRPKGVRLTMESERTGSSCAALVRSVSIQPGAMALTRMSGAQATASDLVSCATPPFDAVYAGFMGEPKVDHSDATLTMAPREAFNRSFAARHMRMV